MPKGQLLKRWSDWSAGIGHLVDDGRTPGMYYAAGLLGLRGELRPAPFFNKVGEPGVGILYYTTSSSVANIIVGACLRPAAAGTAVARSATATTGTTAASTTLTISNHTVPSGESDQCTTVGVTSETGTLPSGVTYDGDALTQVGGFSLGSGQASLWRKVGPNVGTADVVVTWAGAHNGAAGVTTYANVHQTTPFGALQIDAGTGTHLNNNVDCYSDGTAIIILKSVDVTPTEGPDQTSLWDVQQSTNVTCAASEQVVDGVFLDSGYHFQYFFDEVASSDATIPFLYFIKSSLDVTSGIGVFNTQSYLGKIILSNTNFGDCQSNAHELGVTPSGQPAKYQGTWNFPVRNDKKPRALTTIGTGDISGDTLSSTAASFVAGTDHLAQLNHQLVGIVEDGTNPGGVVILKVDGTATTDADWGVAFQAGDKNERATGLRSLAGLTFVLNVDGLYSFNNKGRSGLVFEDFRHWRNVFKNLEMTPWRAGLLIPHPSGLLFYVPGELPVNVGVDSKQGLWSMPPSGPTELHQGIHHSTTPIGDYVYALYQPDTSSTSLLVLCGYPEAGDPRVLVWQCLGKAALNSLGTMQNCYVSTRARPISDNFVTPTFFFGNGPDLSYAILDPRASPFRSRADTHKVTLAADAYMSELRFTEPVDLTELVVHTSKDMVSGDEFQIKMLVNGTGDDSNIGNPIKGSGSRHVLPIDRRGKVTSLVLHVNWTATSAANRVPPVIQSIELFGVPSVGEVQQ